MDRVVKSVETIAIELDKSVFNLRHPCLPDPPHHERYKNDFANGLLTDEQSALLLEYIANVIAQLPSDDNIQDNVLDLLQ